jgi:S-DNA-T family DNA segregation ATPase FtsK/SpoIIIE
MSAHPLSRQRLEYLADRIEAVLAHHSIDARVSGGAISPRWIRFNVLPELGTKINKVKALTEEIALALDVPRVRVSRISGSLSVEVPLDDPQPIYLLNLLQDIPALPPVTAALGLSIEGDPYTLDFTSPEVTHVLVAGATGSGKTELMRSMLLSLALYNRQAHLQLALVDPKKRGFTPLDGLPHLLYPIATEAIDAETVFGHLVAEMERRDQEGVPATPRIVVAVDEVADLLMIGSKNIERYLIRIAQRGREAGIHLVLSTQKPSADAIPSALKANLPARLIGKVASGQDALVAAGVPGTNAELLMGVGDFLAVVGGRTVRFQAAYADATEIQLVHERLHTSEALEQNTTTFGPAHDTREAPSPSGHFLT